MASNLINTTIIGQATRIFAFPDLAVIPINDFTTGLVIGADYGPEFSSEAPIGSCCQAFRCYGRPNVGLEPLPTYSTLFTKTVTGTQYTMLTMADMKVIPNVPSYPSVVNTPMDILAVSWTYLNQSTNQYGFSVDFWGANAYNAAPTLVNMYTANAPYQSIFTEIWPNMARGWVSNGATSVPTFLTHVPAVTANTTMMITSTPTQGPPTTFTSVANAPILTSYANGRHIIMCVPPLFTYGPSFASGPSNFLTSDINNYTNFIANEYFFPESAATVASWGSISTGEFWYVMSASGAVTVYGDIQNPTQAIFLPGVQSAGNAIGEAIASPLGLIYCTDSEGVWVWNGGNTSTKLSINMPDNVWRRNPPVIPPIGAINTVNTGPNYRNGLWGDWVMFAGGWMLDTYTGGWWQMEDPAVNNMQVWCGTQPGDARFFYSSTGLAQNNAGSSSLPVLLWDKTRLANTWSWTSNTIPAPGAGVVYRAVEICASNRSTQPATITITPTAPPGRTPYANQIRPAPSVTFTVPPTVAGYRKAMQVGWDDYNICVNVLAAGATGQQAPTLHELNLGYELRVT